METTLNTDKRKDVLLHLFHFVSLILLIVKVGVLLYFQYQTFVSSEKLVAQQFLLIETVNKRLENKTEQSTQRQPRQRRYRLSDSPHTEHVKRIETDAGMKLRQVVEHIMRDEGKQADPYPDNIGIAVGVGRNLTTNGISSLELRAINPKVDVTEYLEKISIGESRIYIDDIDTAKTILNTPLSDHHIALLLIDDLKNVAKEAEYVFGETWTQLDFPRKESIVDIMFNLGLPNFLEFKKFIAAIKGGDYQEAANELLLSKAAQQNPTRYQRNAGVIRDGDRKHFELD